jgi:type IV secretory pathway protease TraF
MTHVRVHTLGDLSRRYGCPVWAIRRLYERGLLAEPLRVGPYRVVAEPDVAAVEAALRAAGYLPSVIPALA